ncbi:MAG: hypothetical protein FWE47_01515 [Oscillospiraceae bacterium]|nr:hypothetical protein [Oscillospiraceae bacterium]
MKEFDENQIDLKLKEIIAETLDFDPKEITDDFNFHRSDRPTQFGVVLAKDLNLVRIINDCEIEFDTHFKFGNVESIGTYKDLKKLIVASLKSPVRTTLAEARAGQKAADDSRFLVKKLNF